MKDTIQTLTPEKVILSQQLAQPGTRLSALLIDVVLFGAVMMAVGAVLSATLSTTLQALLPILMVAGWFVYFIVCEGLWSGMTLGKRAMNIRVVMADGTPITWQAAIFRNLLRPADMFPVVPIVGLCSMLVTRHFQRVGDLAVGTIVVVRPNELKTITPAPHRFGVHPLEKHIPDLRRMTPEDYILLKRLCDRFPAMTDGAKKKLVESTWKPYSQKLRVPDVPGVHPIYLMEAVVMKYGRERDLL